MQLPYEVYLQIISFIDYPYIVSLKNIISKNDNIFKNVINEKLNKYSDLLSSSLDDVNVMFFDVDLLNKLKFKKYIFHLLDSYNKSYRHSFICHLNMFKIFLVIMINNLHFIWIEKRENTNEYFFMNFYRRLLKSDYLENNNIILPDQDMLPSSGKFNVNNNDKVYNTIKNIL